MIVVPEERRIESSFAEWVGHGYTAADGVSMRPAEYTWHLIFTRQAGVRRVLVVGALEAARCLSYSGGAESLWLRFRVGTFMPHLPAALLLNRELCLPECSGNKFWLDGDVWEIPTFENVETFVGRLVRAGALASDPLIEAALRGELADTSARTLRYRFQHRTGLRQNTIRQIKRAERAQKLLREGHSILRTAYDLGYADQAHLTRSLKRMLGYTPRALLPAPQTG